MSFSKHESHLQASKSQAVINSRTTLRARKIKSTNGPCTTCRTSDNPYVNYDVFTCHRPYGTPRVIATRVDDHVSHRMVDVHTLSLAYSLPVLIAVRDTPAPASHPAEPSVINRHRASYLTFQRCKAEDAMLNKNQCRVESKTMWYKTYKRHS